MSAESVLPIAEDDGPPAANLLMSPVDVIAVTNSAEDIMYCEGRDYVVDRERGRIIRPSSSRMPFASRDAIALGDGSLNHGRLSSVTYTHRTRWRGTVPDFAAERLTRTIHRLHRQQSVTMCLTGDSISEGYDASGFHHLPPRQPPFGVLVATSLQVWYGAEIHFHNLATAGWTAADGLWNVEQIAALRPDLVIVAFGMNDAAYADAAEFATNISGIVNRVRERREDTEFVLVAPMRPTAQCSWVVHSRFDEYRTHLAALTDAGIALADLTTIWTEMLARKHPHELSGNGLNHPNDFGHRVYAHALIALLTPSELAGQKTTLNR